MAHMMRQQPPLLSSPCASSPENISHHFGQLLVGCCVPPFSRSHRNPRPRHALYFYFFRRSIHRPKQRVNVLPTRSSPAASPLNPPPLCRRNLHSVDCCVDPTSGGHPSKGTPATTINLPMSGLHLRHLLMNGANKILTLFNSDHNMNMGSQEGYVVS